MGNCCGSEEKNFQGEGRTLGPAPVNAPTPNSRAAAPKISPSDRGRTLGTNSQTAQSGTPGEAAARAAEGRVKGAQGKGKLGKQLDSQRGQTQSQTLAQNAHDNVAARNADAAADARNWN